jgi:TonB family protein
MTTLSLPREEPVRNTVVGDSPSPHLQVLWPNRRQNFVDNLRAILLGPAPPKEFLGPPYFRDCWVAGSLPDRAVVVSVIWHVLFVMLLVRLWPLIPSPPKISAPQVEITYYGPINDLPEILPSRPVAKRTPHAAAMTLPQPAPAKRADAYHPRQIIVNNPLHPNHPRQTLIQPLAPAEPPKILPALPNIAVWQELAKPQLRIDPAALARLQPKSAAARQEQLAAPETPNQENIVGAVNIAELNVNRKPDLPISPMSAPKAVRQTAGQSALEPDIAASAGPKDTLLIALSATPAPEMPPAIPLGNLQSRVAISPAGETRGAPGDAAQTESARASGTGPPGLSISNGAAPSTFSGGGSGSLRMPATSFAAPIAQPGVTAGAKPKPAALIDTLKPGAMPEALLGGRTIYTLHINMPNLSSATGSWVLTFAEMANAELPPAVGPDSVILSGPEPLRKVDPKYPPELRDRRVEGEVVLYAVIRKDGTVDSIQLVDGLDPTLDENAMNALAQWKFRPGQRGSTPIDLEAIIHIPFRAVMPLY